MIRRRSWGRRLACHGSWGRRLACHGSLLLAASFVAGSAIADETDDIKKLLAAPIIGPDLALAEVQDFCEARVPRMPQPKTAQEWQQEADGIRKDVLAKVVFRGEAAAWRDAKTDVKWDEAIEGGPGYRIRKLRYEALPGLWIPALLYEPEKLAGKVPVALAVNGHEGKGKAVDYKQIRSINMAQRGMIVLNTEWLGMGQLRGPGFVHYKMNQLDLCGTSGLSPFYLAMKRGLDVLLAHENADPTRVCVSGLSGGGWQTIIISSLDTRVTLANPVAGYSSFLTRIHNHSDLGDSEQTPADLATVADYAHLTAMMAPRGLLLTYNVKDNCCFASGHALPPLLESAGPIYKLFQQEGKLRSHVNHDPGTHNFERENREALYAIIGDLFFAGSESFPKQEIDCEKEVKTAEQLDVPLPEDNLDFNKLALGLAKSLPKDGQLPGTKDEAVKWQAARAEMLARIVKYQKWEAKAQAAGGATAGGAPADEIKAASWRLRIGDAFTVPAVELTRGEPKGTVILVADAGRAEAAGTAQKLLAQGNRVVAIDPFYFGESKIKSRDFLFALLVSAVGERPLGVQASQVAAIARWLAAERKTGPVTVVAVGQRSSLYALVAAALEKNAIAGVTLHGSLGSLKEVIEQNGQVDKTPELFCFGLLERFDIKQLAALAAPGRVQLVAPSERARAELADLKKIYDLLGKPFDPLAEAP
ncbi:MAG: acetylxylan esterase [Planctomycetia bacterium]|nr:acetylxylan esterase [Planctomycetia bacterium]